MIKPQFQLAGEVRVVVFDDEAVVFNPFTWESHVLNAAATLVLERLQAGPCSEPEVEQLLEDALDESESARAGDFAVRLLEELATLRLLVSRND